MSTRTLQVSESHMRADRAPEAAALKARPLPARPADQYAATLTEFFIAGPGSTKTATAPLAHLPRFDLVFLGMGPDGHTASLFPHTTALEAGEQVVVPNYVEKLNAHRITLTAATINN